MKIRGDLDILQHSVPADRLTLDANNNVVLFDQLGGAINDGEQNTIIRGANSSVVINGFAGYANRTQNNTIINGSFCGINNNNNSSRFATWNLIASGQFNAITANAHNASSNVITGGNFNSVSDHQSCIIGSGANHVIKIDGAYFFGSPGHNAIIVGNNNTIRSGRFNAIVAGTGNYIRNYKGVHPEGSFIGAGSGGVISGSNYSAIIVGRNNKIYKAASHSFIGSGYSNRIFTKDTNPSEYMFIGTGSNNTIYYHSGNPSLDIKLSSIINGNGCKIRGANTSFIGTGYSNIIRAAYDSLSSSWIQPRGAVIMAGGGGYIGGSRYAFIGSGNGLSIANFFYNTSNFSAIISGTGSYIQGGKYSFIGTGRGNRVSGLYYSGSVYQADYSVILSGRQNLLRNGSNNCFIGTGYNNQMYAYTYNNSYNSTILNGRNQKIIGGFCLIGGGQNNVIDNYTYNIGRQSAIVTGNTNLITGGQSCFIGSGKDNQLLNYTYTVPRYSGIVTGNSNRISGSYSFVGAGRFNRLYNYTYTMSDNSAIIAGQFNKIWGIGCFIGSGFTNRILNYNYNLSFDCSIINGQNNDVHMASRCLIGSGVQNKITRYSMGGASSSAILTGSTNELQATNFCVIAGGYQNKIFSPYYNTATSCFIGAGRGNVIDSVYTQSLYSSIISGRNCRIDSGQRCFIGTGSYNTIQYYGGYTPDSCAILIGSNNTINGATRCMILGGQNNNINVPITDAFILGSNIPADRSNTTHIENLKVWKTAGFVQVQSIVNGSSFTLDFTLSNKQEITLNASISTLTITSPQDPCELVLKIIQGGGGSNTITWTSNVKWSGGTPPTLSTANGAVDMVKFYYDGAIFYEIATSLDLK